VLNLPNFEIGLMMSPLGLALITLSPRSSQLVER
jgi:hypothetical protein